MCHVNRTTYVHCQIIQIGEIAEIRTWFSQKLLHWFHWILNYARLQICALVFRKQKSNRFNHFCCIVSTKLHTCCHHVYINVEWKEYTRHITIAPSPTWTWHSATSVFTYTTRAIRSTRLTVIDNFLITILIQTCITRIYTSIKIVYVLSIIIYWFFI